MWQGLAIEGIKTERLRQDNKWGEQNHHPEKWMNILMEEVGEASKAILEQDFEQYRKELIEVAAVAVAAIESYHRDLWVHRP